MLSACNSIPQEAVVCRGCELSGDCRVLHDISVIQEVRIIFKFLRFAGV
jgi:hypothetical protein